MSEEVEEVRAALRKRFGANEKELELMLSRHVGQHQTVRSFFQAPARGPERPRLSRARRRPPRRTSARRPRPDAVAQGQVERLARYYAEDSEALLSLLTLRDDRVFLYSLTAFLPSLELLASDIRDWVHDEHLLVGLQQKSLAAEDADERARFLNERITSILDRLSEPDLYTSSLSN